MTDSDATQGDNMSPAEFAKLMGAYPQPAENPLPTYGGYMDNSAANFAWVNNNDYFGAENFVVEGSPYDRVLHEKGDYRIVAEEDYDALMSYKNGMEEDEYQKLYEQADTYGMFYIQVQKKVMGGWETIDSLSGVVPSATVSLEDLALTEMEIPEGVDFDAETFEAFSIDKDDEGKIHIENKCDGCGKEFLFTQNSNIVGGNRAGAIVYENLDGITGHDYPEYSPYGDLLCKSCWKEEAENDWENFYGAEATFEARTTRKGGKHRPTTTVRDGTFIYTHKKDGIPMDYDNQKVRKLNKDLRQQGIPLKTKNKNAETFNGLSAEEYYAEMEELTDGVASITNRFGDGVGIIQVDDEDLEDVSVEITDGDGDVVYEGILGDEDVPEMEEDDYYFSEDKKKSSILPMALGIAGAIFAYQPVMDFLARKTKKEEKMAETPELIENPNTGNLDPAQYEELVVESTGYAVDVIPQVLDGSFMGSRFAALPTERYVEYSDPGIGAHTDIAMNRDEIYLEPEMAMVQASESVKESQAPGQSPYNSVDGEENRDFDMRVLKETQVISLDPAVKPFIPQSMSGYTGNANTPPSVYDKMFNIGVLGQTPAFVPGSGDIGSSHTGSRSAIPNSLGIAGSVGGPLSDKVNANYTDGTTSMSLAQWAIENTVSQSSDTEAVVIDRSSGQMKRVRRV